MDYSYRNPNPTILNVLILCSVLILHSDCFVITNSQNVIYSHCPNQTEPNPSHFPLLSNLFEQFVSQSSKSSFFETIVADEKIAISGAFQCRKNLSADECRTCVSKFSALSENLCGKKLPARIQLAGCYAHYQEEDGAETETNSMPDTLLHRACSKRKIKRTGFEEAKYAAFEALETCVMSENGFCETTYESISVSAQCGGSLRHCDCGECVNNAVQIAGEDECRYSVSGEIYLDSCFISFDYGRGRGFGAFTDEGNSSLKWIAVVVGGFAALSLGIGFCYFIMSCGKKENDW